MKVTLTFFNNFVEILAILSVYEYSVFKIQYMSFEQQLSLGPNSFYLQTSVFSASLILLKTPFPCEVTKYFHRMFF